MDKKKETKKRDILKEIQTKKNIEILREILRIP